MADQLPGIQYTNYGGNPSTGAPGTGTKGVADPSLPNSSLFGAAGDFFHTGAEGIGSASPGEGPEDGGTGRATDVFGILNGSNAPQVSGTTATTAGDPDGQPVVGNQPDNPANLLGGRLSHFHN